MGVELHAALPSRRKNHPEMARGVENDCSVRFSEGKTAGEGSSFVGGAGSIAIEENEDRGAVFGGDGAEESALAKSGRLGHFGNK